MLNHLALRTRLSLIVVVVVAGLLATIVFSAISSKEVMLNGYKEPVVSG